MALGIEKKQRREIGAADMRIATQSGIALITHALGSGLGIAVHDPVAGVGGMLHVMLPQSSLDPTQAAANPETFVDTGVPRLFKQCYRSGATKERLRVTVAGGAALPGGDAGLDPCQVGERNLAMLRELLRGIGMHIEAQDVGGSSSRTMCLDIGTGIVTLSSRGRCWILRTSDEEPGAKTPGSLS